MRIEYARGEYGEGALLVERVTWDGTDEGYGGILYWIGSRGSKGKIMRRDDVLVITSGPYFGTVVYTGDDIQFTEHGHLALAPDTAPFRAVEEEPVPVEEDRKQSDIAETRERIVALIAANQNVDDTTADTLAWQMSTTARTIKEHLKALVASGRVRELRAGKYSKAIYVTGDIE
jgi:hypothetical protein